MTLITVELVLEAEVRTSPVVPLVVVVQIRVTLLEVVALHTVDEVILTFWTAKS